MVGGWFAAWLAVGCAEPPEVESPPLQGVVAPLRTVDGAPLLDAEVRAGSGSPARPDAASTTYFFDLPPGRAPMIGVAEGHAFTLGVPRVLAAGLTATSLRFLAVDREEPCDGAAGVSVALDGATLSVAPGDLVDDDGAPIGACTVRGGRPTEAERAAIPGDQTLLANDDELVPVDLHEAFFVEIVGPDGDVASLAPETRATVTLALPDGHPLRAVAEVRAATFSRSKGYWSGSGDVSVDAASGVATFTAGSFGWYGLGLDVPERGCVPGRVRAGGAPAPGTDLVLLRPGLAGVDRVTTDERGAFCVPGDGRGAWSALAYGGDLTTMWTAAGTDLSPGGTLTLEGWDDADGDRAFAGPGGDCDDADPAVAPDPVTGDGSFCGDGW